MAKDEDSGTVVSADFSGVRTYGSDTRDEIEPFKFRIGGSPEVEVREPDAGTVMDIEEAGSSRQVLALYLGEDWPKIEEHLNGQHPTVLVDLVHDMGTHFKLRGPAVQLNRAERRREQRRRR